jgi:hypothetical protein
MFEYLYKCTCICACACIYVWVCVCESVCLCLFKEIKGVVEIQSVFVTYFFLIVSKLFWSHQCSISFSQWSSNNFDFSKANMTVLCLRTWLDFGYFNPICHHSWYKCKSAEPSLGFAIMAISWTITRAFCLFVTKQCCGN